MQYWWLTDGTYNYNEEFQVSQAPIHERLLRYEYNGQG